jgi:hypothetical protein
MRLIATVQVASTGDDPLDLARKALEFRRASARADQRSSLKMSVAARDNSRIMKHVKSFAASQSGNLEHTARGFGEVILTDTFPFVEAVGAPSRTPPDAMPSLAATSMCSRKLTETALGVLGHNRSLQLFPVFHTGSWCDSNFVSNQRVMVIFCCE